MQSTRDRVLDVVVSYIKKQANLTQVSISEIAKKADIGKSTVYEYFKNKDDLIKETYLYLLAQYEKKILQPIVGLDYQEAIRFQLTWILDVVIDAKSIMEVILSGHSRIGFIEFDACSKRISEMQDNMEKRFEEIFRLGLISGELIINQKPYQSNLIQALTSGLMFQYADGKIEISKEDLIDLIIEEIKRILK